MVTRTMYRQTVMGKHPSKKEMVGLASKQIGEERDRVGLWVSLRFGSEELGGSCTGLKWEREGPFIFED